MRWWLVGWVVAIAAVGLSWKFEPGVPEDFTFTNNENEFCTTKPAIYKLSNKVSYTTLPKADVNEVHAASSVMLLNGSILTVWYGGSREGAADVKIYSSRFNPSSISEEQSWSKPQMILSPDQAEHALGSHLRKLGNPVISQRPDGTLDLYVVSVSLGGWAGSQINWMSSTDQGHSWSSLKPLWTAPISNISTLVKAPPLYFKNGWIGLPVYHEFMGKFAEFLIMDSQHRVVDKIRLSYRRDALQPWLVALDDQQAIAYMRFSGESKKEVLQALTTNAGVEWNDAIKTGLPNPNSSVAAIHWKNHGILIVFNRSANSRRGLSLAFLSHNESSDIKSIKNPANKWRIIYNFEEGSNQENSNNVSDSIKNSLPQLSYPYILQGCGEFHIFYSYERDFIRHVRLDESWLLKQITEHTKSAG